MKNSLRFLSKAFLALVVLYVSASALGIHYVGAIENNLSSPTSLTVGNDRLAVLEPFAKQLKIFTADGVIQQHVDIAGKAGGLQALNQTIFLYCDQAEQTVKAVDIQSGLQYNFFGDNVRFGEPIDIIVNNENIYILDAGRNEIAVGLGTGQIEKVIPFGRSDGFLIGYASTFAYDQSNNLFFIFDQLSSEVLVFDQNGNFLRSFGSFGDGAGQITRGGDILFDQRGYIYVVDRFQNRVVVFQTPGDFVTNIDFSEIDRPGLANPTGLALDANGVLYIASTERPGIEMFLLDGNGSPTELISVEPIYPAIDDTVSSTALKLVAKVRPGNYTGTIAGVDFELYASDDISLPIAKAMTVETGHENNAPDESRDLIALWYPDEILEMNSTFLWRVRVTGEDFVGEWTSYRQFSTSLIPARFELEQNYPNPFNPATQIAFSIPAQLNVRLTVYNMLGQQVKQLVDGSLPAGSHEVTWDGQNDNGTLASSGVYFYRLTAGKSNLTRKMVMLK